MYQSPSCSLPLTPVCQLYVGKDGKNIGAGHIENKKKEQQNIRISDVGVRKIAFKSYSDTNLWHNWIITELNSISLKFPFN